MYRIFYGKEADEEGAKQFIRERLENNESIIFVAVEDSTYVGFTQLYLTFTSVSMGKALVLNDLYVKEEARGMGIAHRLLQEVQSYAQSVQAKYVQLETAQENIGAQSLYKRFGFAQEDHYVTFVLDI